MRSIEIPNHQKSSLWLCVCVELEPFIILFQASEKDFDDRIDLASIEDIEW